VSQVWSRGSAPASPTSSDIVMKSQSWLRTSEDAQIVLVDSEGKVSVQHCAAVMNSF